MIKRKWERIGKFEKSRRKNPAEKTYDLYF